MDHLTPEEEIMIFYLKKAKKEVVYTGLHTYLPTENRIDPRVLVIILGFQVRKGK